MPSSVAVPADNRAAGAGAEHRVRQDDGHNNRAPLTGLVPRSLTTWKPAWEAQHPNGNPTLGVTRYPATVNDLVATTCPSRETRHA